MTDRTEILSQFLGITGCDPNNASFYLEACSYDLNNAVNMYVSQSSPSPSSYSPPSGIRTFSDVSKEEPDKKKEVYYAGGGKSGIAIENPNKPEDNDDYVKNIFKNAQDHGAISAHEYKEEKPKFTGGGYTLGTTTGSSQFVAPEPETGPVKVKLTFFKDGFTVDDGEKRSFNDPQNQEFMEDINKGFIPRELERLYPGREVHVELLDKKGEDYKEPPKPSMVPFTGSGNKLGTVTNKPVIQTGNIEFKEIVFDPSKPRASMRIHLAAGGNITIKCNKSHTVGDVYSHIKALNPNLTNFELRTSYPVKTLTNLEQTVEQAGLIGASLVQRI